MATDGNSEREYLGITVRYVPPERRDMDFPADARFVIHYQTQQGRPATRSELMQLQREIAAILHYTKDQP